MRETAIAALCLAATLAAENALVSFGCIAGAVVLTIWPTKKRNRPRCDQHPERHKRNKTPSKTSFHR